MNETDLPGPCAGYEFEIADLLDGALGPQRAGEVRTHLQGCARCRAWQARLAQVDGALAAALPRPALSADFAAKLKQKIDGLAAPAPRSALRAIADLEYQQTVRTLGRSARRSAISVATLVAGVTAIGVSVAVALRPEAAALLRSLAGATGAYADLHTMNAIGTAMALGALAWSALRGMLPGIRLRS